MKHDMGGFYRLVRDRLAEAGHPTVAYNLGIEWWNFQNTNENLERPVVRIYVAWGLGSGVHYQAPDFDRALRKLMQDLVNHPPPAPPVPPAVPDVEVLAC